MYNFFFFTEEAFSLALEKLRKSDRNWFYSYKNLLISFYEGCDADFLVGELDDIPFVETIVPNLFLVPAGKIPPHPSELLGSERMRDFLDRTKNQFGRIIIDSPPLMSATDAAIISTQADGVLLVVKAEYVPRKAAMDAKHQLLELNAPLLGTIFNKFQVKQDEYFAKVYYRYHYHYTRDHGSSSRRGLTPEPGALGWVKNKLNHLKQK